MPEAKESPADLRRPAEERQATCIQHGPQALITTSRSLTLTWQSPPIPRVQGGEHNWENLVCACVKCNAKKGGRTPQQSHLQLIRKPTCPKRNPSIMLRLGSSKYQSWKAFLDEAYWTVELKD